MNLFAWLWDLLDGVNKFFFKPSTPHTLAMIRIMAGLGIFYINLNWGAALLEFVGPQAWIGHDTMDSLRTSTLFEPPGARWDGSDRMAEPPRGSSAFSFFYHVTDSGSIWMLHWCFLAVNLMFALGLFTRFTGVATWIASLSYIQRAQTSLFGMDTITSILLFYLMFSPCGGVWSLDRLLAARRARRQGLPEPEVQATPDATFFQRLMQVHFAIIYFGAGTSKLMGASWWQGTALWGCLANYSFSPMQYEAYMGVLEFLADHRWLWELVMSGMAVFTLVLELGFPFAVWMPQMRLPFVICAILFHTGIGILMGLRMFSFLMCALLLSFLKPGEIRGIFSWIGGWLGLGENSSAQGTPTSGKIAA